MTAHRSLRVLGRSLLQAVPTVIGVVLLSFFLLQAVPGDAADVIAAESGSATEASMAALRSHFGLDQPVLQQLGAYLRDLATLNLGVSPRYNLPVSELIFSRLGNTVLLMGSALACALAAGIALGAVMASFAGRWLDRVLSLAALLPCFWVYQHVGSTILRSTGDDPEHPYRAWIRTYAEEEFADSVLAARELVDRAAAASTSEVVERMFGAFTTATEYEWMFWNSAWHRERWPTAELR